MGKNSKSCTGTLKRVPGRHWKANLEKYPVFYQYHPPHKFSTAHQSRVAFGKQSYKEITNGEHKAWIHKNWRGLRNPKAAMKQDADWIEQDIPKFVYSSYPQTTYRFGRLSVYPEKKLAFIPEPGLGPGTYFRTYTSFDLNVGPTTFKKEARVANSTQCSDSRNTPFGVYNPANSHIGLRPIGWQFKATKKRWGGHHNSRTHSRRRAGSVQCRRSRSYFLPGKIPSTASLLNYSTDEQDDGISPRPQNGRCWSTQLDRSTFYSRNKRTPRKPPHTH